MAMIPISKLSADGCVPFYVPEIEGCCPPPMRETTLLYLCGIHELIAIRASLGLLESNNDQLLRN